MSDDIVVTMINEPVESMKLYVSPQMHWTALVERSERRLGVCGFARQRLLLALYLPCSANSPSLPCLDYRYLDMISSICGAFTNITADAMLMLSLLCSLMKHDSLT